MWAKIKKKNEVSQAEILGKSVLDTTNSLEQLHLPFNWWGNWDSEKWNDLLLFKVLQEVDGKVGVASPPHF